jgi:DmsE family decaheme c-type cytochrome
MAKRTLLLAAALLAAGACAAWAASGGDSPCLQCHDDVAKAFAKGPHGAAMAARSPEILDRACAGCHGPAEKHLEDPSKANVSMPGDAACLACHAPAGGKLSLASPGHARDGVGCLDCHASGHGAAQAKLLKGSPESLCGSCHAAVAAKFRLPFAHRRGEKPFSCLSCHAPHGTGEVGRLSMTRSGGVCIACHTEKAGPFVYPHPPREVDGCIACHDPHGSPNPRQLVRYRVADLCIECHTSVPSFHNLSNPRYQPCQRCHVAVHGSNRNPNLFDE